MEKWEFPKTFRNEITILFNYRTSVNIPTGDKVNI